MVYKKYTPNDPYNSVVILCIYFTNSLFLLKSKVIDNLSLRNTNLIPQDNMFAPTSHHTLGMLQFGSRCWVCWAWP